MADKIQEISRETQQLKAKIQSLRDVCSKETEKAQVRPQHGASISYMSASLPTFCLFHSRFETNMFNFTVSRLCMTRCQLQWMSCTGELRCTLWT